MAWRNYFKTTPEFKEFKELNSSYTEKIPKIPKVPSITNLKSSFLQEQFQERAAIYEFEANFTREEAELWAKKDILMEFITKQYPTIISEFEAIIYAETRH